jgi:hypothetical protein
LRIIGSPLINASAIVPGPACVSATENCGSISPVQVINNQKKSLISTVVYWEEETNLSDDAIASAHPLLHLLFEPPNLKTRQLERSVKILQWDGKHPSDMRI